ncbi:MAG TPA: hypothetical protein VFC44_18795 [Candidatus Saccharimonadales bacterium]|nr:hypothetical protein [Candidatus Saccharimonadales bacterium]
MTNKVGRPTVPKSKAKTVLLGARFSPSEAKKVELDAANVEQDKSKWIRGRLLDLMNEVSPADLHRLWFRARILTKDGQELSKGAIKLRIAPGRGVFVPDQIPCLSLDIPPETKLVAEIEKHHFDLSDWESCGAGIELAEGIHCIGPHYHFSCPPE